MAEILTTGDARLDKLITDYSNAAFDCGEHRDPGEDPCYDEDRKYQKYEDAAAVAASARRELFEYLRHRLGASEQS